MMSLRQQMQARPARLFTLAKDDDATLDLDDIEAVALEQAIENIVFYAQTGGGMSRLQWWMVVATQETMFPSLAELRMWYGHGKCQSAKYGILMVSAAMVTQANLNNEVALNSTRRVGQWIHPRIGENNNKEIINMKQNYHKIGSSQLAKIHYRLNERRVK